MRPSFTSAHALPRALALMSLMATPALGQVNPFDTGQDDLFAAEQSLAEVQVPESRLRFSAFGDFTYGLQFGPDANADDAEAWDLFGDGPEPYNTKSGFGMVGTDFVIFADLTDRLAYVAEVNFQVERTTRNAIEVDVERMFINYVFNDQVELQVGQFFTHVGYWNRNLYARAWLKYSAHVDDVTEEELNYMPTHSTGILLHGRIPASNTLDLNWGLGLANGRNRTPTENIFERDFNNFPQITMLLEFVPRVLREARIGLSGWIDQIQTADLTNVPFGQVVTVGRDTAAQSDVELLEAGFNPYIVLQGDRASLLAEYWLIVQSDTNGRLNDESFTSHLALIEVAVHFFEGQLHPYARFDLIKLPDEGGPYFPLRGDGETEFFRVFVPQGDTLAFGLAYDVAVSSRLKLEYTRFLEGPRQQNGLVAQLAFGF